MRKARIVIALLLIAMLCAFAIYNITIYMTRRSIENFTVRGVDLSSYQGDVDWNTLSSNGIDFAFIKATEGSFFKDRFFKKNIQSANETNLLTGAYHFMSFESDGESQAKNFIDSVPCDSIDLPPVIDLELYGSYNNNPPKASVVKKILDSLITQMYVEYGRYPIIYTNRRAYSLYISGDYKNCDIWICDIIKTPTLPDGRDWTFWQYSHTEKLDGYEGEEEFIDMNVFNGSKRELLKYAEK